MWIIVWLVGLCPFQALAQADSLPVQPVIQVDTGTVDTISFAPPGKSGLKSKVQYNARDSIKLDMERRIVILYGAAVVHFEDMTLEADTIAIDFNKKDVIAGSRRDSTGKYIQKPKYKDNDGEYSAEGMAYNFDTKKGRVFGFMTQEGDGIIYGEKVKKDEFNNAYVSHGRYTTCIDPHPHFYIQANKLKIIPDKQVVTGPANLVIADVPTPGFIPFGFFPIQRGQKSGILFPSYGESANRGFFLSQLGYYFAINERLDLAIKGDVYFRGSYALSGLARYSRRYQYNGNVSVSYAYNKIGNPDDLNETISPDFRINWDHTQDGKHNPNSSFGAKVNIVTSNFMLNNSQNATDIISNTFNSSVNYGRTMGGGRYNLTAALRHDQNVATHDISFSLPEVTFGVMRFMPFQRKVMNGPPKWYDNLGLSYNATIINRIATKDTLLFRPETLKNMSNGMSHTIPISTSFNMLKYLTVTPSISYNEYWYLNTIRKTWDDVNDTLLTERVEGFERANTYNGNVELTTRIYGLFNLQMGRLMAIRHALTPSVGFFYSPDFSKNQYGYYRDVQVDAAGKMARYSIFEGGVVGGPSAGEQGNLTFRLNNNLEAKIRRGKDTSQRIEKIKLFDYLNVGGYYNFLAKNFKLSSIAVDSRTMIGKNFNIVTRWNFDPYGIDTGVRVDKYLWKDESRLVRLTAMDVTLSASLNKDAVRKKTSKYASPEEMRMIDLYPGAFVDFDIPWNVTVNYRFEYSKPVYESTTKQTIFLQGDFNLTPKWKIGGTTGYDFTNKSISFTSLDLYRDLHCWEMQFNWIPVGYRKSFLFSIHVKAAALTDLKLNKRGNWFDQF